jgi:hypothetical protein
MRHFSGDELSTGVLTPYGSEPVVIAPEIPVATAIDIPARPPFDTEGAGDSLVWVASVNEILALYNGSLVPWDNPSYYSPRLEFSLGSMGGCWTRSPDDSDISKVWIINTDGSFSSVSASTPSIWARPVISADHTVMLYKRGTGSEYSPYEICYPWQVASASISASAAGNLITLNFTEAVVNNGVWPRADAWEIVDSIGTTYFVTGTTNRDGSLVLTVYPALVPNAKVTVKYAQRYDDETQGLNNTRGAILRSSMPYFALAELALEVDVGDLDSGGDDSDPDSNSNTTVIHVTSSSGCDTGLGIGALLLLCVFPVILRTHEKR